MSKIEMLPLNRHPINVYLCNPADDSYKGYFHYHQGMELLYVHQGKGTVVLEQQVYPIKANTLFLFQPFQLHHVRAIPEPDEPYVRSILHIEPSYFEPYLERLPILARWFRNRWKGNSAHPQVFALHHAASGIEALFQYYKESLGKLEGAELLECKVTLIIQLLQLIRTETKAIASKADSPSRLLGHTEKALNWIELHYMEPFSLERLSKEIHLNKYHLSHLFVQETGSTITDCIMARRMKEACKLLAATSLPAAEVGSRVGWPVPSHFTHQFKRWTGCTPMQYRKENKQAVYGDR